LAAWPSRRRRPTLIADGFTVRHGSRRYSRADLHGTPVGPLGAIGSFRVFSGSWSSLTADGRTSGLVRRPHPYQFDHASCDQAPADVAPSARVRDHPAVSVCVAVAVAVSLGSAPILAVMVAGDLCCPLADQFLSIWRSVVRVHREADDVGE
jgi:hypothetical protein